MGTFSSTTNIADGNVILGYDVKTPIDALDTTLVNILAATQTHTTGVLTARLSADPSTPSAGSIIYDKAGTIYARNQAGTVTALSGGTVTNNTNIDITATAGETLSERDAVYITSTGTVLKLDADATSTIKNGTIRGIVVQSGGIASSASGSIRIMGAVTGYAGLTAGGIVYASTTAGGITQTKPVLTAGGGQRLIASLGYATSTTAIYVQPLRAVYAKRESLTTTSQTTIEHHADEGQETRRAWAVYYPTGTVTQASTNASNYAIGESGGVQVWGGQGFQVTQGGRFTQATFSFATNVGTPSGTVTWELRSNNAGVPSSTILESGTFTPTASATNTITPAGTTSLAEGTLYWLILRPTNTQSSGNRWQLNYSTANPYAYDSAFSTNSGASWTASSANDLVFTITTVGNEESLIMGRWGSGTRDVALRYTDSTGVASSTNTSFRNVSGGTLDLVFYVEV